MQKIPCEVIRDLLPSYVDGLTSEQTNRLIREHLDSCEECRRCFAAMQAPMPEAEAESEKKEINFLKKNKKKNRKVLIGSLLGSLALILGVLAVRTFVVGAPLNGYWLAYDVKVTGGKTMILDGTVIDSLHTVSKVDIKEEEDGVIKVSTKAVVATGLYSDQFHKEYEAKNYIYQIWLNDRIIWEQGETIAQKTFDVFETRHAYIGDMPANQRTAEALQIQEILGGYTNELETAAEPYGWKLILEEKIPEEQRVMAESDMESLAYVLLGLVGNLDHVTFEAPGFSKTVTAAQATEFLGQDIKDCSGAVRVLDRLIRKTGLFYDADADFEPDSVKVTSNGTKVPFYTEKDPDTVERVYDLCQDYMRQLPLERVEEEEAWKKEALDVVFRDSVTGQTREFQINGPYLLVFEEDEYRYYTTERGEEIYNELYEVMKKLEKKG